MCGLLAGYFHARTLKAARCLLPLLAAGAGTDGGVVSNDLFSLEVASAPSKVLDQT